MLSFHWHQIKFNEKRGENGCVCLYLYSAYNSIEERWSYICENLYIRRIAFNVKQQTVNQTIAYSAKANYWRRTTVVDDELRHIRFIANAAYKWIRNGCQKLLPPSTLNRKIWIIARKSASNGTYSNVQSYFWYIYLLSICFYAAAVRLQLFNKTEDMPKLSSKPRHTNLVCMLLLRKKIFIFNIFVGVRMELIKLE